MTAATPGRDELREQIAAALVNAWRNSTTGSNAEGYWDHLADAVMEPVDAWVAAHTAEDEVPCICRGVANGQPYRTSLGVALADADRLTATVARVEALCDEMEAPPPWRHVRVADVRAALDPPTEAT